MALCSCPWCPNEAVAGQSSVGGQPTCDEHSIDGLFDQVDSAFQKMFSTATQLQPHKDQS